MIILQNLLRMSLSSLSLVTASIFATSHGPRPLVISSDRDRDRDRVIACIPSDEGETVDVFDAGITPVGSLRGPLPPKSWRIRLNDGAKPTLLKPGQCLAFDQPPVGYTSDIQTSELRDGWPYTFSIGSSERGKYGTRNHSGEFCVQRTDGALKVVQIPRQPETITPETCRKLLGTSAGK